MSCSSDLGELQMLPSGVSLLNKQLLVTSDIVSLLLNDMHLCILLVRGQTPNANHEGHFPGGEHSLVLPFPPGILLRF